MSNRKTGEWLDCTLAAKPTSKKAKHKCATVTVTFAVEGDDYPSHEVADRLVSAPVLLDMTERRLAEVEAERDALRSQATEASRLLASALCGAEQPGEVAHLPALARMMVDALTLEAVSAEQARMQLDSDDDVDAATRRYLGEALGIADPNDTPPSLSDFYDAVVEARDERDTLRRLCLEAADMLDEPTAIGDDAMDAMAARLRAAGGER